MVLLSIWQQEETFLGEEERKQTPQCKIQNCIRQKYELLIRHYKMPSKWPINSQDYPWKKQRKQIKVQIPRNVFTTNWLLFWIFKFFTRILVCPKKSDTSFGLRTTVSALTFWVSYKILQWVRAVRPIWCLSTLPV